MYLNTYKIHFLEVSKPICHFFIKETRMQNGFRNLNFNPRPFIDCKHRIYNKGQHRPDNDRNGYADWIDESINCIAENQKQIQTLKRKVYKLTQR